MRHSENASIIRKTLYKGFGGNSVLKGFYQPCQCKKGGQTNELHQGVEYGFQFIYVSFKRTHPEPKRQDKRQLF